MHWERKRLPLAGDAAFTVCSCWGFFWLGCIVSLPDQRGCRRETHKPPSCKRWTFPFSRSSRHTRKPPRLNCRGCLWARKRTTAHPGCLHSYASETLLYFFFSLSSLPAFYFHKHESEPSLQLLSARCDITAFSRAEAPLRWNTMSQGRSLVVARTPSYHRAEMYINSM